MNILEGIAKIVKSVLFISSKLFNCKLHFLHGMIEDTVFIIMVIMNLSSEYPNGKMVLQKSVWVNHDLYDLFISSKLFSCKFQFLHVKVT